MAPPQPPVRTDRPLVRRRTAMSCDRCKSRKTKCVDPVPGPCHFCASIGAPCHLDPARRRQRPYYRVSEEEFRYMTQILEHFVPNQHLDLETLKSIANSITNVDGQHPRALAQTSTPLARNEDPAGAPSASLPVIPGEDSTAPATPGSLPIQGHVDQGYSSSELPEGDPADLVAEEIDDLHGRMAWLRVDSNGVYRHVGPSSTYIFFAAVRSLNRPPSAPSSPHPDILAPLSAASPLPPAPTMPPKPPRQVSLPRRDLCNLCIARFMRDVQPVYRFFSAEQLDRCLDRIYAGDATAATPAILCALYSIFAMTCESQLGESIAGSPGMSPSGIYLSLAKALVPAIYDAADVDSIRALCLLGLALSSSMFASTAYVYIGSAARIAFTLGLHYGAESGPRHSLHKADDMSLFCTLYMLDLDITLCYGDPPAISEEIIPGMPPLSSEDVRLFQPMVPRGNIRTNMLLPIDDLHGDRFQELHQVLTWTKVLYSDSMPHDYLEVSCRLGQLQRTLNTLVYRKHTTGASDRKLSINAVSQAISSLEHWRASLPLHLSDFRNGARSPRRSIPVLHLRYWRAIMFATRPFLLYTVACGRRNIGEPSKQRWFDDFGARCIRAAQTALEVIGFMRDNNILSSIITFDCASILECMQVFLLALTETNAAEQLDNVKTCLVTLQGMEQILWTKHAVTEVKAQLEEHGILRGGTTVYPGNLGASQLLLLDTNIGLPSEFPLCEPGMYISDAILEESCL